MADINKKIKVDIETNIKDVDKSLSRLNDEMEKIFNTAKEENRKLKKEEKNRLVSIEKEVNILKKIGEQVKENFKVEAETIKKIDSMSEAKYRNDIRRANDIYRQNKRNFENLQRENKAAKEYRENLRNVFLGENGTILSRYGQFSKYRSNLKYTNALTESQAKEADTLSEMADIKLQLSQKDLSDEERASLEKELQTRGATLESISKERKGIERTKFIKDTVEQSLNKSFKTLIKFSNMLGISFSSLTSGIKAVITSMADFRTGIATYSSSSLVTNAEARRTMLTYGLSGSQAYAFTQAKSMLNISSDEDLMYMNSQQREKFLAYMQRYQEFYDYMESTGMFESIQDMQLSLNEFKQEVAMEFLQWIAANKETIMAILQGTFSIIKTIANLIGRIVSFITGTTYHEFGTLGVSERNNINNTNSTKNIKIDINNTNNATGVLSSTESLNRFNEEYYSNLGKQLAMAIESS